MPSARKAKVKTKPEVDLFGDPPMPKLSKGYAAQPGSGPANETCGSCLHLVRWMPGDSNTYFKCGRIRWTCGEATDIRMKTPACEYWQTGAGLEADEMWCSCAPTQCQGLDRKICRAVVNPRHAAAHDEHGDKILPTADDVRGILK
jgi:hypothetical protein